MPVTIESAHPYPLGTDETKSGTIPGAHHVFIRFDPLTQLAGADRLQVLDENDVDVFGDFFGGSFGDYSVLGQTAKVHLNGTFTGGAYGYKAVIDDTSDVNGPYLIDTANFQKWIGEATGYPGPYRYGNAIYVVFYDDINNVMGIFKSTDGGVTFIEHAGSPDDATYGYASPGSSATKIRICYDSVATNHMWVIGEWDMATDTWTEITTHTDVVDTTGYSYDPVLGKDYVFYRPAVQGRLYVKTFDGSSWDAGLEITDNLPTTYTSTIGSARADEDGDLHIVYRSAPNAYPPVFGVYYRQMKGNGTLTSPITLNSGLDSPISICGRISFTGTCIVIPFRTDDPAKSGSWRLAAVYKGSDYHDDAPTFVSPITVSVNNVQEVQAADGPSGLAYVWWNAIADPAGNGLDSVEYRSIACDGTLGSIVVFHDDQAYPSPANDVSGQFLHDLGPPVWIPGTQCWDIVIALEYNPLGTTDQFCTGFYWQTVGCGVAGAALKPRVFYYKPFFPPR